MFGKFYRALNLWAREWREARDDLVRGGWISGGPGGPALLGGERCPWCGNRPLTALEMAALCDFRRRFIENLLRELGAAHKAPGRRDAGKKTD
jgi:hypothetical protein